MYDPGITSSNIVQFIQNLSCTILTFILTYLFANFKISILNPPPPPSTEPLWLQFPCVMAKFITTHFYEYFY